MTATPPLFIVGNDRSGTTMLRLILDAGAEIAIPPESMILTDYGAVWEGGELGDPEAAARFMAEVWWHPKIALWKLEGPPPAVPPGLAHTAAYRFVMEAPFRAYARQAGKPRWGDKTPHYVHHIAALLEVWPDARFVILVRDGRDVALSVGRMPFGPNNAWAAASWWARGIRAGEQAQTEHPAAVMTVRYEDLVSTRAGWCPRSARSGISPSLRRCSPSTEPTEPRSSPIRRAGSRPCSTASTPRPAGAGAPRCPSATSVSSPRWPAPSCRPTAISPGRSRPPLAPWQERLLHWHNQTMRQVNFVRLRVVQERGRELRFALERRFRPESERGRRLRG